MLLSAGRAAPARRCAWQCQQSFIKMLWNAPARHAGDNNSAVTCLQTPGSFTTVILTFALTVRYAKDTPVAFSPTDARAVLPGLDILAERMAAELRGRYGSVHVLLSLRNSSLNTRGVVEVLEWARALDPQLSTLSPRALSPRARGRLSGAGCSSTRPTVPRLPSSSTPCSSRRVPRTSSAASRKAPSSCSWRGPRASLTSAVRLTRQPGLAREHHHSHATVAGPAVASARARGVLLLLLLIFCFCALVMFQSGKTSSFLLGALLCMLCATGRRDA